MAKLEKNRRDELKIAITKLIEESTKQFEFQTINKVLTDMLGQLLNEGLVKLKDADQLVDYKVVIEMAKNTRGEFVQGAVFYKTEHVQKFKILTFMID